MRSAGLQLCTVSVQGAWASSDVESWAFFSGSQRGVSAIVFRCCHKKLHHILDGWCVHVRSAECRLRFPHTHTTCRSFWTVSSFISLWLSVWLLIYQLYTTFSLIVSKFPITLSLSSPILLCRVTSCTAVVSQLGGPGFRSEYRTPTRKSRPCGLRVIAHDSLRS